jgi:23S rRNA (adenine2503-C2)-methyltransferase
MEASKIVNILDHSEEELKSWLINLDESPTHSTKIMNFVYKDLGLDFEKISGLSRSLNSTLVTTANVSSLKIRESRISADQLTSKVLFETADGETLESTFMSFHKKGLRTRRTVCVSSQIGCVVGCQFCATGQQGFTRNLSVAEIIEQILYFARLHREESSLDIHNNSANKITNIVFMGMGEPLSNYDNVVKAIRILNLPHCMNLGSRQITLSTSGIIPQIRRLSDEKLKFELAVSLHSANDKLRNYLVPINAKYPLDELISACRDYSAKTRRLVFIEYALFDGINDRISDANELVDLLDGLDCSINLILGNWTENSIFKPSSKQTAQEFQKILSGKGLRTIIRQSKGADIDAGCGQLRSRYLNKK